MERHTINRRDTSNFSDERSSVPPNKFVQIDQAKNESTAAMSTLLHTEITP